MCDAIDPVDGSQFAAIWITDTRTPMMSFELEAIFTDTVFADDGIEICTTLVAFPLRFVCCNGRDSSDATVSDICVLLLTYVMVRDNVDALLAKSD